MAEMTMRRKRRRKWALIAIVVLTIVASLGWVSNANSKAYCQRIVGTELLTYIGQRGFFLLAPRGDIDARATFDSLDAQYLSLDINSDDPKTWPRLSMKTSCVIPFFVSVDYFWEREAEIGGGATKWFFCLFGMVFEIGDASEFAT